MSTNDSLLKKRAMLESMMQDYALAGLPPPEETQQEFAAVVSQLGHQKIAAPNYKTWVSRLGTTIGGCSIDRLVRDDSYSFLLSGKEDAASKTETGSEIRRVIRIAKDSRQVDDGEKLRLSHATQCMQIEPFKTSPIEVAPEEVLAIQFARLKAGADERMVSREPNIVAQHDDLPYFKMPYMHGTTLREVIDNGHHDDSERRKVILRTLIRACNNLEKMKEVDAGFYHGNLKPENIISTSSDAVLFDPGYFGPINGLNGKIENGMLSTIAYYPFLEPDDLLALGICLYEGMTGVHPFSQRLVLSTPDAIFDESGGASKLGSELCDTINFRRSMLEPYSTPLYGLQLPTVAHNSAAMETILLKGLRIKINRGGLFEPDPGFKDFKAFAVALEALMDGELNISASNGDDDDDEVTNEVADENVAESNAEADADDF